MNYEISTVNEKITQLKENYIDSLSKAEDILSNCRKNSESLTGDPMTDLQSQIKLNSILWNGLKVLKDNTDEYKNCEKLIKEVRTRNESNFSEALNELENHEELRIQTVKDSLKKLMVYEVSMDQNHLYDLKQLDPTFNSINPKDDIQVIIATEHAKNKPIYQLQKILQIEFKNSDWGKLFEVFLKEYYGKKDSVDYDKIVDETKRYIDRNSNSEYKNFFVLFRQLNKQILNDYKDPDMRKIDVWKKALGSSKGRCAFIDSLNESIALNHYKLTQSGYKILSELILYLINEVISKLLLGMQKE